MIEMNNSEIVKLKEKNIVINNFNERKGKLEGEILNLEKILRETKSRVEVRERVVVKNIPSEPIKKFVDVEKRYERRRYTTCPCMD